MKVYHRILGVPPDATHDQIKRAYRRLAMKYHPDRNPDPEAMNRFQEIKEAYENLIESRDGSVDWSGVFGTQAPKVEDPLETFRENHRREFRRKKVQEEFMQENRIRSVVEKFRFLGILPAAILVVVALDFLLPSFHLQDHVINVSKTEKVIGTRYAEFHYLQEEVSVSPGDDVTYESSRILKATYNGILVNGSRIEVFSPHYPTFLIGYVIILIMCSIQLIRNLHYEVRMVAWITGYFAGVIILLLL